MIFSGIAKNSLVDYPGMVACVLFVPGCNYDCFYCHNRSLIDGSHTILDTRQVWDFLKKRAGLLDAVVLSGGEPTLQKGLSDAIREIRTLNYKVKLDTNGSRPEVVERLLAQGLLDYAAVDYKAPAAKYERVCGRGADAKPVRETIGLLMESGIPFEVRTTVFPQLQIDDLTAMARELPEVPRYTLNAYRMPESYKPEDEKRLKAKPAGEAVLNTFADAMRPCQPGIRLG